MPLHRFDGTDLVIGGTIRRWDGTAFVPPLFDLDVLAYLAATGIADVAIGNALDVYVRALKVHSLWTPMQAIYPFVGGTPGTNAVNLKSPGAFDITWHGSGVHSSTGYQPGGNPANFGDTHYVPSSNAIIDDAALSIYSRTDSVGGAQCDMGSYDPDANLRFHLICRYDNDAFYPGLAERGSSNVPSTDSTGLFATARSDMAEQRPYRNGVPLGTLTVPADTLPTFSIYIGRLNNFPAGPGNREYCFMTIGRSLDDTQMANLYTLTQALQTTLGRQV